MYGIIEPDENFPNLRNKKSALSQCLTKQIYSQLFWKKTSSGYTIDQAIQIGADCDEEEIGFLLGDYECIEVFEPLLSKILDTIHPHFDYTDNNVSHSGNLKMIKFDGTQTLKDFVIEYAFHLRRNLRGYSLPPQCTRAERREINRILIYILKQLQFDSSLPHFQMYQNKQKKLQDKSEKIKSTPKSNKKNKKIKVNISNEKNELQNNNHNNDHKEQKESNSKPKKQAKNKKKKTKKKKAAANMNSSNNNNNNNMHITEESNGSIVISPDDDTKTPSDMNGYTPQQSPYHYTVMDEDEKSQVVDLVNIDDLTLTELEEMGLAPARDASLSAEYLIGGLSRDFPDARTLFYNRAAMVGAWTNHENHFEMIIQHTQPDLNYVYKKFVDIYVQFRRILKRKEMAWIRHRRLGIVTTSPKHFGTGLTIQCSIRAPYLSVHPKFERILNKRSLELIGSGVDEQNKGVINLETRHTLGRSEFNIATDLGNHLIDLCRMEKALARNKDIEKLI